MMDKGRTKIIFFIIILIIFSFEKTFANSQFLSKQCIKHLTNNCDTNINITGEYIKSDYEKEKIKKGELFLGKFYNQDICDKATQLKSNEKDLEWSKDKDLIEFVVEAKRRKLKCNVKKEGYASVVYACLYDLPKIPQYCEQLKDIRGPYPSLKLCIKRSEEIIKELPEYRAHMEPRGFKCEKL